MFSRHRSYILYFTHMICHIPYVIYHIYFRVIRRREKINYIHRICKLPQLKSLVQSFRIVRRSCEVKTWK